MLSGMSAGVSSCNMKYACRPQPRKEDGLICRDSLRLVSEPLIEPQALLIAVSIRFGSMLVSIDPCIHTALRKRDQSG